MILNYQDLDIKKKEKTTATLLRQISTSHISHVRLAKFQSKASVSGFRNKSAPLYSQWETVASRAAFKNTGGDQEETGSNQAATKDHEGN